METRSSRYVEENDQMKDLRIMEDIYSSDGTAVLTAFEVEGFVNSLEPIKIESIGDSKSVFNQVIHMIVTLITLTDGWNSVRDCSNSTCKRISMHSRDTMSS
jgi:hypothetical protein